jgi:hypothetical protein
VALAHPHIYDMEEVLYQRKVLICLLNCYDLNLVFLSANLEGMEFQL